MLKKLWNDELGVIISAELVLVLTIAVLALIVGLHEMAVAINTELNDLSNAFGALRQSYAIGGFRSVDGPKTKALYGGTTWEDAVDDCDTNLSCDIVVTASALATTEG